MARAARAATRLAAEPNRAAFCRAKIVTARVYAEQVMPRAAAHVASISAGSEAIMTLEDEQF